RARFARAGCIAAAAEPLRQGDDPALLRGARVPDRLADPRDDHRPERRPADLVVQPDAAEGQGDGCDRLLEEQAVEAQPPGRPGRERIHRAAALSGPQGRALPGLQALREPQDDSLTGEGRRSDTAPMSRENVDLVRRIYD